MSVHGSGSNLHRQLQRDEHARTLQFLSFVDAEAVKAGRVVAVSDCQVLLQCAEQPYWPEECRRALALSVH